MADEQKPEGSASPPPPAGGETKPAPPKPAAPAGSAPPAPAGEAKAAPPKPAAHAAPPKPPAVMAATPWDGDLVKEVKEHFGDAVTEASTYLGQSFFVCKPDAAVPLIEYLKLEADFDYLVDITAVDWPKRAERFDLVYILYSFARNERIRVKTYIADGYRPPTAVGVHLTANWLEREVFDMFGIEFGGHPDMRRILLPEEWEGYPLRKDYGIIQQDDRWVQENLGIESGQ
jgi:NADH-quinone oxidoreductase subunit C